MPKNKIIAGYEHEHIPITEFDELCDGGFADGPYRSSFGDGPYQPYNPYRDVWGTLRDGRRVWSNTAEKVNHAGE